MLRPDPDDICNPLQRRADLHMWRAEAASEVAKLAPALARCIAHVWCVPRLVGEATRARRSRTS